MSKKQKPIDIHTTGYYEGQLSDDINELLFNVKAYFGIERKDKHPIFLANINRMNLIEQHIQTQANKLNAIREVVEKYAKGGRYEFYQLPIDLAEIIMQILGDE